MKIGYNFTLDEILDCTGGQLIIAGDGTCPFVFNEIFTDSREEFSKNSVFVAFSGKIFNGERFIDAAFKKGAPCAIVSWAFLENYDISHYPDKIIIAVEDTVDAYGQIAKMYLSKFTLTEKIAITGSCGKTTTKDMVHKILSEKYGPEAVLKNLHNFNNLIGVPRTILGLNYNHKYLVLEIGTNKKGEIKKLAEIISPNVGAIINIGKSHLLEFKDINGVMEEKLSLALNLKENSNLIFNSDDKALGRECGKIQGVNLLSYSFGQKEPADIVCDNINHEKKYTGLTFRFRNKKYYAKITFKGKHLISDFFCAILIGYACGIDIGFSVTVLEDFSPPDGRMQIVDNAPEGYIMIHDAYNSNPDSFEAAMNLLNDYYADKKKILVIGDMLELGDSSETEHFNIGVSAAKVADYIFYKGYYLDNVKKGLNEAGFDMNKLFLLNDKDIFMEKFSKLDKKDSVVLIKGSRGIKLEEYFDLNI